jgi:diaminopimelate decarboxylase
MGMFAGMTALPPVPTDSDMLDNIRRAKAALVSKIAQGQAPRRISMGGGLFVENQDSDKLLMQLEKMERHYEVRVEGRQGGRLTP